MKFNNYSLIIILFQYINNIFEYKIKYLIYLIQLMINKNYFVYNSNLIIYIMLEIEMEV